MGLTRAKVQNINFDVTNITDPLIRINSGESGSADKDAGIVIERGSDANVAIIYDESEDQFAVVNTSEDGTTSGNVTITSYANIKANEFHGDGSNLTGVSSVGGATGVDFNDSVKARFGTGNDLEIYHDASDSYIRDSGTGNLLIQSSDLYFGDADGSNHRLILRNSTGRIGINDTNPDARLEIHAATETGLNVEGSVSGEVVAQFKSGGAGNHSLMRCINSDNATVFDARANGYINVGKEGTAGTASGLNVHNHGWATMATFKTGTSTSAQYIQFQNSNGTVGNITWGGTSTSYNTSSDYRLKENVVDLDNATDRLKQLKPKRFNFTADDSLTVDGFLAHEVSSVVPEAVSGTKDEVEIWQSFEDLPDGVSVGDNKLDDNSNTIPKYQAIDQSKLVPLLVKTIQELEARITALES